MDLYCKRCGEPWEFSYVTDEMTVEEKADFHSGKCCPCCEGKEVKRQPNRAKIAAVLGDILGDDIDGLASEMDEAESLLGPKFWD